MGLLCPVLSEILTNNVQITMKKQTKNPRRKAVFATNRKAYFIISLEDKVVRRVMSVKKQQTV